MNRNDPYRRGRERDWDQRDLGTRGGDYTYDEPGLGQGAGGRSFREMEPGSYRDAGERPRADYGYAPEPRYTQGYDQSFGPNYDRSYAPGYGGSAPGSDYGAFGGYGRMRGASQESYASGRDFGGQGGYGGYGASQGGMFQRPQDERAFATGPSFRGKGPKGYRRTDERLQELISERLTDDYEIDASDITVLVKSGVVTLEGSVAARQIKHRVEDIVEQCGGVDDIRNNLTIQSRSRSENDTAVNPNQTKGKQH